jgi:hypothetical protein
VFSVAGEMRTLSSINTEYHCLIVMTDVLSGEFSW